MASGEGRTEHYNSWGQFWRSKPRAPSYLKNYPKTIKSTLKLSKILVLKIMLITHKLPHRKSLPCLHFGPRLRCWSYHSLNPFVPAIHSYIPNNFSGMSVPFVNLTHLQSSYATFSYTDVTTLVFCCCIFPLVCNASQLSSENLPIALMPQNNSSKIIWQFLIRFA